MRDAPPPPPPRVAKRVAPGPAAEPRPAPSLLSFEKGVFVTDPSALLALLGEKTFDPPSNGTPPRPAAPLDPDIEGEDELDAQETALEEPDRPASEVVALCREHLEIADAMAGALHARLRSEDERNRHA